jgi:hypothetical protein
MKAYDIVNGGYSMVRERAHSSSLNILIEEKKEKRS